MMHEILNRSAVVDIYGCGGFRPKSTPYYSPDYTDFGAGESVSFQNRSCRACDHRYSSIDVRHTFTLNAVYQLPFGPGKPMLNSGPAWHILSEWEMSGIASARTGLPVNITDGKVSQMLDGNTSSRRPDLVPGESIYAADQTISQWFNAAALATSAKNTWGALGRNVAFSPGNFEADLALQKRFRLSEKFSLDVRAAAFTLANHPEYGNPASNRSKSSFGEITSVLNTGAVGMGASRRIEFMTRVTF